MPAAGQEVSRVHGTWKTVPMETRIERRYSGSAHCGVTSTASTPSAAAERNIAPTFVWSTMSSSTATVRAPSSSSATPGSSGRCMAASAPRCRWKPVSCSSSASSPTNTGTSGKRSYSGANFESHFSLIRKERGAMPASIAREMTS